MVNNEQWKSGGNCNKCRRQSYCHKYCKAHESFLASNAVAIGARILKDILEKKK